MLLNILSGVPILLQFLVLYEIEDLKTKKKIPKKEETMMLRCGLIIVFNNVLSTKEICYNWNIIGLKWSIWVSYKTDIVNFFADMIMFFLNICRHLRRQLFKLIKKINLMPNTCKGMTFFLWVRQTVKYFFLFSHNKSKDVVHLSSQWKNVDVAIYLFKIFIKCCVRSILASLFF